MNLLKIMAMLCGAFYAFSVLAEPVILLESGVSWSLFKGTEEPSNPSNAWRERGFDDSAWSRSNAPFYYGEAAESGTELTDMRYNYSSIYLRKNFELQSGSYEDLQLRHYCDDGFILWINGTEIYRFNVGEGEKTHDSLSSAVVSSPRWETIDLSSWSRVLIPGATNCIAIQAFNITLSNSSDFAIDIELTANQTEDRTPPTVSIVSPAEGTLISNPPKISVVFSEGVTGVDTNSIWADGIPAIEVTELSPDRYFFTFAEVEEDCEITLSWNSETKIYDRSGYQNVFVPPQSSWSYFVSTSMVDSDVIINEFLTSNNKGLTTQSGKHTDWIELYNKGESAVDIGGWYLTDSEDNLTKWKVPAGTILPPDGYLVIFCDDSAESSIINGEYFANFNLSKAGEYLALVCADGVTIASQFAPSYPPQYSDISYDGTWYYKEPTPGQGNGQGYLEPVGEVIFSESRGYKSGPFTLTLDCATPEAIIYYTLDGTVPTTSSIRYTEPLTIDKITYIRALAVKEGHIDSKVVTRTWLFAEEALTQSPNTPNGWPDSYQVNNHRMVYGLNADVVNDPFYAEGVREGLTNIPTISMVTDLENLFNSSSGIYVNPGGDGILWERPASLELIDPNGGDEFQIEAGIRIRGGFSRSSSNPKHSFRFFFRNEYGGKLNFPLFGEEGADVFDKVDLRTSQNYAWSYLAGNPPEYNTFIRETFARDSQRDVGMPYTRSRYYHLFINGQCWGLYQTQERSEADFAETYLGGNSDDWDCIKSGAVASDGNAEAFTELHRIAISEGFAGNYADNYYRIKGLNPDGTPNPDYPQYLDEDNLIQFILNYYYTADPDSPIGLGGSGPNNLYGLYNRVNPSGFTWYRHDAEHSMGAYRNSGISYNYDMTSRGAGETSLGNFTPVQLHQKLMDHPDYKMRFIDLFQSTYLNENGAMSLSSNLFRWNVRQQELDKAIYTESARWARDCDMRYEDWIAECNWVKNVFITNRQLCLEAHLKNRGWYPSESICPQIFPNGGEFESQIQVEIVGSGVVYYTTDGSDPRLPGGDVNSSVQTLAEVYSEGKILLERGSEWNYYDLGTTPELQNGHLWYQVEYPSIGWKQGNARFGFGPGEVATEINQVKSGTTENLITAYFTKRFQVNSVISIPELILHLNCDDGAVIYINGRRVVNHNMPNDYLTENLYAASDVSGENESVYVSYQLDPSILVTGENVIAVEVHQSASGNEDLYFDLELESSSGYIGSKSAGIINVFPGTIIKARSLSSKGEWSALAEADFTVYAEPTDLKVTEMMYSAEVPIGAEDKGWSRDDYAWIELQNIGNGELRLDGIKFVEGIEYIFPKMMLSAGEYVVLVKNLEAFSTLYDTNGLNILSGYSGNLSRKGETITLQTAQGEHILSYTYSNSWYPQTDEGGYSLKVNNVLAEESLWSTAENWSPSEVSGGSPGCETLSEIDPPTVSIISPGVDGMLTLSKGEALSLSVEVGGSRPLSCQWYKDDEPIPGATEIHYLVQQSQESDSGVYTVSVSNRAGSVLSQPLSVTVEFILKVVSSSINGPSEVEVGRNALYTCQVNFNDGTSDAVQPSWNVSPAECASITESGELTGLATGSIVLTALYTLDGVTNSISKMIEIVSSELAPQIITQPESVALRVGQSTAFTVEAIGASPLSYQWYVNNVAITKGVESTFVITNITQRNAGYYTVEVRNDYGSVVSDSVELIVLNQPEPELLLDYQFNEGEGNTTVDSVSQIIASLPNTGIAENPWITTESPSGLAGDHAIELTNGRWLLGTFENEPLKRTEPFTWEGWVNVGENEQDYRDLMRLGGIFKVGFPKNNNQFQATFLGKIDMTSSIVVPTGKWVHLACAWEPDVGVHFYLNGVYVETYWTSDFPLFYQNSNITIGADDNGTCVYAGMMDRVRIHQALLKEEDLDSDAENPKSLREDTIFCYDFEQNEIPFLDKGSAGISLYDGSGGGNITNNAVNWSFSTPISDYSSEEGTGDYSLRLSHSASTSYTSEVISFPPEELSYSSQLNKSFSVEAWLKGVKPRQVKQVFLQILGSRNGDVPSVSFAVGEDMKVVITTMGIVDFKTDLVFPEDDIWHHLACVYDDINQMFYVYLDGALGSEASYTQGVDFTTRDQELRAAIGSECSGYAPFVGYIDRLRFYKGILTLQDLDYNDYSPALESPVITRAPSSQTVNEGQSVTLSVEASGTEPLIYQWYKNGDPINGAVTSAYTIKSVNLLDAGNYTVKIINEAGETESDSVILRVNAAQELQVIVDSVSRVYGEPNPSFTYQILDENGVDMTGVLSGSPELTTTALPGSNVGEYPIMVSQGSLPVEYKYRFQDGVLTILRARPQLVWSTPESVIEGTILGEEQLNASADVEGEFEYTPSAGTVLSAGEYTLSVLFTPINIENYETVQASVLLRVLTLQPQALLNYQVNGNQLILIFEGVLEESEDLTSWTRVENAAEPYIIDMSQAKMKFYRAVGN